MDYWKNKEISQQSGNNYWEQQAEKAGLQAQERLENRQRYGVELSDEEYAQINSLIADSDNYDEEAHHIGSAILFSKQLGIPVNEAYTNLKDYTDALYGTDQITSYRTGFEAIKDMFIIGNNGLQIGELGNKLKRAEADGDEELIKLYSEQIERLNKDNELRQDNAPRSWVTEALKTGAQTLPFSGQAALLGLFGNFIIPGLGTVLAFGSSSSIASGQEYVDMRNEGVSPQTARIASEFSGGIQGLIEVSLGTTTEYLAAGAGKKLTETAAGQLAKKASESFAKRFHYGPTGKLVVNFITNKLADSTGEAAEEALQQITSQVTNDIARSMDGLGFSDKTIAERSKEIADAAVGGFVGAIVLGIPIDVLRTTADIKDYKNIKEQARTTPSGEMFYNNVKDNPVFAEVSEEKKKSIIEQVWKNAQNEAYEEETLRAKEIAEVNTADSNFEDIQTDEETGETNAQPVYRENGLLQTEDTITEDNGNIKKGTYRTGNTSTKEKNLYGYINYTIDEDNKTVTIDNFSMNNAREGLRAEFYDQFAEKFADYDIKWDPILKAGKNIKEELITSNPNGKNKGLNYYSGADIADIQTRKNVAAQIKKNITKMSDNEVAAAVTLLEAGAKRQNMSITDYVNSTFGGQIFGDIAEAEQQAQMQGATFQGKAGAMQWKQFGQQVRAVIYAGENADFSTFAHELAHVYQGQLQGDLKTEAEAAFNVQNGDWQNSTVVGKDGKTYSSAEAFAYGFQDWLKTGRAENEQMKNIFQKFAEFISRCINALKDHINLSPEIESVYNQLLSGDDSLLAKAEKAVAQQDNEYRQAQREAREQQKAEEKAETEKQKQQEENNEAANSETTFDENKRSEVVKENLTTPQPAPEENNIDSVVDSLNMDESEKAEIKDILNNANSTLQEKSEAGLDAAGSVYNDDINGIPSDMFFQIIGEYGATQLDREEEVTTRIDNLNIAREMETAGKDTKTIRLATGWEKGVDGKWRYEISDDINIKDKNNFYFIPEENRYEATPEYQTYGTLEDNFNAPSLFTSYPELKETTISIGSKKLREEGSYDPEINRITLNPKYVEKLDNAIKITNEGYNVLVHEIQHIIQKKEGFAVGGNPETVTEEAQILKDDFDIVWFYNELITKYKSDKEKYSYNQIALLDDVVKEFRESGFDEMLPNETIKSKAFNRWVTGKGVEEELKLLELNGLDKRLPSSKITSSDFINYKRLAGEVESRNVESRRNMTTEERLNTLLSETEDVARNQQIILFQAAQMAAQEEENIQDVINQSMTMERAKEMIQRTFILGNIQDWYDGEYKNGDEWLAAQGSDEVAMYADNEYQIQNKYLNNIQGMIDGDFSTIDIIDAYVNKTLTGKVKTNENKIDLSKDYGVKDFRWYVNQQIKADNRELYQKASERITEKNKEEVTRARVDFITKAHDKDFAESIGVTQAAINAKLRQWALYPKSVLELSNQLNAGVASANKWTGLENSNLLKSWTITENDLNNMVKEVTGNSSEWQRGYIVSTMLALDTHIDYSELTYEFGANLSEQHAAGTYNNREKKIRIDKAGLNTVAHETGHYLDNRWGQDILGRDDYLTDNRSASRKTDDADINTFLDHFYEFLDDIENSATTGSQYSTRNGEYWMSPREVFARFVARFCEWTRKEATNGRYDFEEKFYKDNFTTSQYKQFVKILQEKSLLDNKKKAQQGQLQFQEDENVKKLEFQTEEELYRDAMMYDTWQDFMDAYQSDFDPAALEDPMYHSQVPSGADAQWYQTTWELAHNITPEESLNAEAVENQRNKEGMLPDALDSLFVSEMRGETGKFEDFMSKVAYYDKLDLNSPEWSQVADAEEAADRDRIEQIKELIDIVMSSGSMSRAINKIAAGGEITPGFKTRLVSEMSDPQKSRDFRQLYAEVMDLEEFRVSEEDNAANIIQNKYDEVNKRYNLNMPDVDVSRMSPQQRKDLSNNIDNIEIAQKLRDGTLKMDDQVSKYIDSLNKQIKDLQTQYKDLNKQILEETRLLADEEQKDLLKINEELIKAKAAYDKSNTDISRKIEKGIKISQKYQLKSQNLKHDYNELLRKYKDALATTKITGEVQRALDTQNKLGAALENIDKLEQERTSMQDIQKLRKNLVKRTMRRVKFDTVDYENARKIIAIQRIFEPNLIGGVNKWIGQNTPYLRGVISAVVTDKEYRNELTNYLRSKAKGSTAYTEFMQKWNELITAPTVDAAMAQFKKWDEKTVKRAALYLPKEDWIKELELKELEKEREESIDLDIELVERREPMRDENGNPIYINQYDENGKLIKNPDVQKQYYKTQWVVETSPEIKAMIKDAVGEDIFNNLLYRPFSDWTTEEMERLAKRVDDLYTEGRDILKARKQAQIERAAEIRKQIQDVVNNTGIVINADDTPEEKEKKQKKIDAILGVSSELKGTEAAKETGAKAKINRLLHGYNDVNVMRVARILDGMDEGVNYNELYRREDDCFIEKTTSMNNRARNIQKVMKDNNITMEELAKTIEIAGRNFSIDEILFIAASNEDYVEDEIKLAKKLTGLEANDDYAATSRNAVMFGNMYSDTDSLAIKEQWKREDEEMQRKIENDELTPEEKQLLTLGQLDKKPGTTKYIEACKGRYAQVLAVANNLDEKYKALLKAISDDYATQYERMNEISIKEFNTPVHRVKCYVPLVRLESNGDTNVNQVKEDLLTTMGAGAGKQWVNKGMTQRRVSMSPLFQKPVQMGLYKTWADSVERTEHFISYSGYVRELNRIYKSRDAQYTRQFIENRYGKGMLKYIDDYINEVANPNANKVREAGSELMHTLRGKTAPAYLAWKASAIIKQGLTSPWPFMQFVNPAEYFAASWKAVTSKGAIYDAIREKSVFMNNRVMDPMNDLIDEMAEKANQNKFDKAINAFNKKGMSGLEWIDWVCVAPGWYACYTKKYAELNGKNQDVYEATKLRLQEENQLADFGTTAYKTPEQIEALAQKAMENDVEKRAVQYADDCTRACQPSNRSVDIAPLFKNSSEAMKAYLQFQTSLNVIWQNLRYDLPYEAKKKQFSKIAGCIVGYALAGIFMNSIMDGLGDDDDKDGKKIDDILRNEIYYATTQFTDSVPMLGSEITNTMDKLITGKASYQTSGTDMTPTATRFFSILTNAKKGNWEKAADMFTEGVGMYLGLPVSGAKELKKLTGVGDGDGKLGLNLGEVYGILDVGE